jgi:cell division protein FtsW
LQGSEFVKLFVVVFIAAYLVEPARRETLADFIKPLLLITGLIALLLQQPDFGAAVVIMGTFMGVLFLAGVSMKFLLPLVGVAAASLAVVMVWQPYRMMRLSVFADPWEHRFDGGYQLTQALIAFGRGEWLGVGLGNSIQKLFFLPEAHTDFLFSIVAEELGIVGIVVVVACFLVLVLRGLWIGRKAWLLEQPFNALLAYGIVLQLGIQATINIGVNVGVLPTKGLTLPLMSFGGNSLIVSFVLVALLIRVDFETSRLVAGKGRRSRSA